MLRRIFNRATDGTKVGAKEAERLYASVLPPLVLLMESMDTFLVYGKQVLRQRLGIAETSPQPPHAPPTRFGVETALR